MELSLDSNCRSVSMSETDAAATDVVPDAAGVAGLLAGGAAGCAGCTKGFDDTEEEDGLEEGAEEDDVGVTPLPRPPPVSPADPCVPPGDALETVEDEDEDCGGVTMPLSEGMSS